MNKRGIAPLLATGLLIMLAIALGVLVLNFGRAQIEIASQCAVNVGLHVVELNNKQQVCFDKNKKELFFIVENGAQIIVDKLKLAIIGEKGTFVQDIPNSRIGKAEPLLKFVSYNNNKFGMVRQLKLTPVVTLYDEEIICPEQAVLIKDVRTCIK